MGFNYYRRKVEDQESMADIVDVDNVIKYNVIPTIAGGTVAFCGTMFLTFTIPYDFVTFIITLIGYIALTFTSIALAMRRRNTASMFVFYGLCVVTGIMQRGVIQFALVYLGSMEQVYKLFAIAVLAATAVLLTMTIIVRAFPSMFQPGSGFMKLTWWITVFAMLGFGVWGISLLFLPFDWYILGSSLFAVFMVGIYTIWDLKDMRYRVHSGQWMYSVIFLSLNYFILIIRIFLLLVLGAGRRD